MNKCLEDLNESMTEEQLTVSEKLNKQVLGEHILIVVLIAIMIGIVVLTSILIIKPLKRSVELIREEKEIPLRGAYEVQFLAKTYNLMYNTNHLSNDHMTYESTHDKMTGLYNTHGYEFLSLNIDMETATLILLDLDNFSQVDHTFGREIGNRVLIKAADTILKNFRAQDYICKLENDEYAVIMIHTNENQKELIEKKIASINEKLMSHEDEIPSISISAGIAFGARGTGVRNISSVAKEALEEAKKKSGGICFKTARGE
jgi:diguanylate cyclase (GGDEF)-like protein